MYITSVTPYSNTLIILEVNAIDNVNYELWMVVTIIF